MIWCLAPLSDGFWSANVVDNFARQGNGCQLVVVENNGGAFSGCADHVLRSEPGKHNAIAAGMRLIGSIGSNGDAVVLFDQDDWYGPTAHDKAADLSHWDVVAMQRRWVQMTDGSVLFFDNRHLDALGNPFLAWGGCVAWRSGAYVDGLHSVHGGASYVGDTQNWLEQMMLAGRSFALREYRDVYRRHSRSHVSRLGSDALMAATPGIPSPADEPWLAHLLPEAGRGSRQRDSTGRSRRRRSASRCSVPRDRFHG